MRIISIDEVIKDTEIAQKELIIPMNERCESLNAAVAATIVMWQMAQ